MSLPNEAFKLVELGLHLCDALELDRARALEVLDQHAAFFERGENGVNVRTGNRFVSRSATTGG